MLFRDLKAWAHFNTNFFHFTIKKSSVNYLFNLQMINITRNENFNKKKKKKKKKNSQGEERPGGEDFSKEIKKKA